MIKILQIVVYFIFILLTVLITGFSIGIIQYILHIRFHHVVMALLIGLIFGIFWWISLFLIRKFFGKL